MVLETDSAVMIVMDFAKIDVYHLSFQILHVIYYAKNFGERKFSLNSYVGQSKEKNDVYFVIEVFLKYIIPDLVKNNWKMVTFFTIQDP